MGQNGIAYYIKHSYARTFLGNETVFFFEYCSLKYWNENSPTNGLNKINWLITNCSQVFRCAISIANDQMKLIMKTMKITIFG